MQRVVRKSVLATLVVGVPYVAFFLMSWQEFGVYDFVWKVALFGLIMTALFLMENRLLKKKGIDPAQDTNTSLVGVKQQKSVRCTVPPHELLTLLSQHPDTARLKARQNKDVIYMNSSMSWFSWGERISLRLTEVFTDAYEYRVTSNAALPLTLVDYGRNLENVLLIERVLQQAKSTSEHLDLAEMSREKVLVERQRKMG